MFREVENYRLYGAPPRGTHGTISPHIAVEGTHQCVVDKAPRAPRGGTPYHLLIFPHGSYHRDPIRKTLPFKTNGNRLMHSADCFPLGQGFQVLSFDNNSECLRFGEL